MTKLDLAVGECLRKARSAVEPKHSKMWWTRGMSELGAQVWALLATNVSLGRGPNASVLLARRGLSTDWGKGRGGTREGQR